MEEAPDSDWAQKDDDHANHAKNGAEAFENTVEVDCVYSDQAWYSDHLILLDE